MEDSKIKMTAIGTCTGTLKIDLMCQMVGQQIVPVAEYPFNETLKMDNITMLINGMQRRFQCSFFGFGFNYTYGLNDDCTIGLSGTFNGHCNKSVVPGISTMLI